MSLIKRKNKSDDAPRDVTPASPIISLRREVDRLFDWFMQPRFEGDNFFDPVSTWMPSTDVAENDRAITVRMEVPGLNPSDLTISLSGRELKISGEKKETIEESDDDYFHSERRFGSFKRTIELPDTADLDEISATQDNGVLTVRIAKVPSAETRNIEIKPAGAGSRQNVPVGA